MKRIAVIAGIAALALPLSGCGFTPLYATDGPTTIVPELAEVSLVDLSGPNGVSRQFQQAFADVLPNALSNDGRYALAIELKEQRRAIAVTVSANTRRFDYYLFGNYVLTDKTTSKTRKRRLESIVSYGVVESQYASLVGREDAERRAAKELARKIELDIALYLKGRAPKAEGVDLPSVFNEELIEGGLPEDRADDAE